MNNTIQIKNRFTAEVIYTYTGDGTMRAALIKAVAEKADLCEANLRGADLYGADLYEADLYGADLREANLREANLCGADLRGADLREANLREANLREANLRGADLRGADLRGAKNYNKYKTTPLYSLLDQTEPIRAYKVVNEKGVGPFNGGIVYEVGKEIVDTKFDEDEYTHCGAGINLAALDWCLKNYAPGRKILLVEFNKLTKDGKKNIVIPVASDGKFRVKECRVVAEKNPKDIGLE